MNGFGLFHTGISYARGGVGVYVVAVFSFFYGFVLSAALSAVPLRVRWRDWIRGGGKTGLTICCGSLCSRRDPFWRIFPVLEEYAE